MVEDLIEACWKDPRELIYGALKDEVNKLYKGGFVFAAGAYGGETIISIEFRGVPDSPWLYDSVMDYMKYRTPLKGKVYVFVGTCRLISTGRYTFVGKINKFSPLRLYRR